MKFDYFGLRESKTHMKIFRNITYNVNEVVVALEIYFRMVTKKLK